MKEEPILRSSPPIFPLCDRYSIRHGKWQEVTDKVLKRIIRINGSLQNCADTRRNSVQISFADLPQTWSSCS